VQHFWTPDAFSLEAAEHTAYFFRRRFLLFRPKPDQFRNRHVVLPRVLGPYPKASRISFDNNLFDRPALSFTASRPTGKLFLPPRHEKSGDKTHEGLALWAAWAAKGRETNLQYGALYWSSRHRPHPGRSDRSQCRAPYLRPRRWPPLPGDPRAAKCFTDGVQRVGGQGVALRGATPPARPGNSWRTGPR